MKDYVSFHNHTSFSVMDALIKPMDLFKKAKELNQSAIAVTDHSTLAAAHDSLIASKETGVKLIMGCEFNFVDSLKESVEKQRLRHVILCAKNHVGYQNLLKILRLANDNLIINFKKTFPRIDWDILSSHSEGLICTTACSGGILGQLINNRKIPEAKIVALKLKEIFKENLALEIQPHALKRQSNAYNDFIDQQLVNTQLIKLSKEINVPLLPTTDAHYLVKEHADAHDVLLAIGAGQPVESGARLRYTVPDFYVKSREEVESFFKRLYPTEAEAWCDNSLHFSSLCEFPEWIDPGYSNPSKKELPDFPVHNQADYSQFQQWKTSDAAKKYVINSETKEDDAYLKFMVDQKIYTKSLLPDKQKYIDRVNDEFEVISSKDFSSYLLIVADILNWARSQNIPVGIGRGSVGGCGIAYFADIHQADPLRYNLIFERFQNREKVAYPDCDLDVSKKHRRKVIKYIEDKYGSEYVASISNYMQLTPKPYARAIARTFRFGGDIKSAVRIGNEIADSIPKEIHSVKDALIKAPLFAEYAKKYPELAKYAGTIGNCFLAFAKHAAGIVISKRPLVDIVPTRRDKDGFLVLEYEKDRAEANGLVKMDWLGLENLDIVNDTIEIVKKTSSKPVPDFNNFNYDNYDSKTYDLISNGNTFGVFQLGTSGGTIELCKKMKAKSIEELAFINALARPASADIRKPFIDAKHGVKVPKLLHPSLTRAFGPTYTFGIYEESLFFLAQDVAGWTLNEADALRKLTKDKGKNPEKVAKLRTKFIEGAIKNNLTQELAIKVWDETVEKFGGYGFNASHATFYSLLGYQTAYLKAHFPLQFLTANLNSECDSNAPNAEDNMLKLKQELRALDVKVLPPDVNNSTMDYSILDEQSLLTGLSALKYMSKDAIPEIIEKRPYTSLEDFITKVSASKVKMPSIAALIGSGCFDKFGKNRKQMFLYAADFRKKASLFKERNETLEGFNYPFPEMDDWTIPEKHALEHFYLGEGLTGTPFEVYTGFFDSKAINFADLSKYFPEDPKVKEYDVGPQIGNLQGIVEKFFEFKVKKVTSKIFGQEMAKMTMRDPFGNSINVTFFPDTLADFYKRVKQLKGSKFKIEPGVALHFAASVSYFEGSLGLTFQMLKKITEFPKKPEDLKPKKVVLKIPSKNKKTKKSKLEQSLQDVIEEVEETLVENGIIEDDIYNIEELDYEFDQPVEEELL